MTIAVTGATGFVGQAVLDRAAKAGLPVRALTRRAQTPRAGVTWIEGDLAAGGALVTLCQGTEAVLHIAGEVNAPDAAGFESGNVAGTLRIIEAAVKAGVPRLIFVSSLAAREPELSAYGASKARAERLVMASGLDWTIVRPPWVYGLRDTAMVSLFKAAWWGVVPMPQRAGRASLIHVDDLACLLLALVPGGEDVTGKVFEPDDGRPQGWSNREIARSIGWAIGRRPYVLHLGPAMLLRAARASRALLGNGAKLTPDRAGYMSHPDWVCRPDAIVPESRWRPRVPTREGLRATVEWYREQGWL